MKKGYSNQSFFIINLIKILNMNLAKRIYFQYKAYKALFSMTNLKKLCEVYEYDVSDKKHWNHEFSKNEIFAQKGQTTNRELRKILSILFVNHSFVNYEACATILSYKKRVLPLFMACLKKRDEALTKIESGIIAKFPMNDFCLLSKPLHPWFEKDLLSTESFEKIDWYCQRFVLSNDAEMHLLLLVSQQNYGTARDYSIDYAKVLLNYVKKHQKAFQNDCSNDFLFKQQGLDEVKELVLSRKKGK